MMNDREHRRTLFLLGLAVILYFFANFQRTVIPGAIFSELQSDLNVSAAKITGFGAMFMYVYAISQLFSGVLADKYGGYRVISCGGLLFCLGAVIFPFTHELWLLYLSRVLVGIGASSIYLSTVKEVQRSFPTNFASVMGVVMLIGYAGGMAANAPFVAMIHHTGWRHGLQLVGYLMLACWMGLFFIRLKTKMPAVTAIKFSVRAFAPAVSKRYNWNLFILTSASFAVFYAFQTVLGKKFLEDYCGMSSLSAGWILTLTGAISALSSFMTPLVSRLCNNRRSPFMHIMGLGTLICAGGALLALCFDFHAGWYFSTLFFLLAICANMTPVFLSLLKDFNSAETLGVCASFSNFLAYFLVAVVGNASGLLMDLFEPNIVNGVRVYGTGSYIAVFILFTVFAFIAFWFSRQVHENNSTTIESRQKKSGQKPPVGQLP